MSRSTNLLLYKKFLSSPSLVSTHLNLVSFDLDSVAETASNISAASTHAGFTRSVSRYHLETVSQNFTPHHPAETGFSVVILQTSRLGYSWRDSPHKNLWQCRRCTCQTVNHLNMSVPKLPTVTIFARALQPTREGLFVNHVVCF